MAIERLEQPVDGRAARRERNRSAVLDVVVDLFTEGELLPTVEQVSKRSGVSVRSIYRYFADPAALHDAAVERHRERTEPLAHLPAIGEGCLADRVDAFVAMRLRVHDAIGPTYRAAVYGSSHDDRFRKQLQKARRDLRAQFERQFAPELNARPETDRRAVAAAGDLLTQIDSIDLLRNHQRLSVAEATNVLRAGLLALLEDRA